MNLAVIGSGGREHSICYKLKQSNKINKLNDISEEICSSWIGSLYSLNIGARSIQRHLSSVKGFFKYLQKHL